MNNNIRNVTFVFLLLFISLVLYLIKFVVVDSKEVILSPYNKRLNIVKENVKRGEILDKNGTILAYNNRVYPYNNMYAHSVGFYNKGKSSIEKKYNFELQTLNNELIQRINKILFNKEMEGNKVQLTLDHNLQSFIYEKMENKVGAVIASNSRSGKILAMVSKYDFDPNNIENNWNTFINDDNKSVLLNRATAGLYPPGSTFKIINALAIIEKQLDKNVYNCTGSITLNGETVSCINGIAHGNVDLEKAFYKSCNTYFVYTTDKIEDFEQIAKYYTDVTFNMPMVTSKNQFSLSDTKVKMQTYIGQGKTLFTPLYLNMLTSAIANGGVMMNPTLVDNISSYKNEIIKTYPNEMHSKFIKSEYNEKLISLMEQVVTKGTARRINVPSAGKTGTAENGTNKDHGLYVTFAPVQNPEIVLTVVLENAGSSLEAVKLANEILEFYFEK